MAKYRILSFDGGGIRGLLTLVILERLKAFIPDLLKKADLLAGTSTGGIIAIGLANGLTPTALRHLYYEKAPAIFVDTLLDDVTDLWGLFGSEYDTHNLREELQRILKDTRLSDLQKKVFVPAFDLDNEKPDPMERRWAPKFFHNYDGVDSDGERMAAKIALYTCLAPTYFPSEDGYIDGGVCANNPSMAALAQTQDERVQIADRPKIEEVVLFSVGTGQSLFKIEGDRHDWGYVRWARPLIDIMIDGVMEIADFQCKQLLRDRYHRLSPTFLPDDPIQTDDWRRRDDLIRIGESVDLRKTIRWLQEHWV